MKYSKLFLTVCIIICAFSSICLAVDVQPFVNVNDKLTNKLDNPLASILGIITVIAGAVAVGMLIFIGIKYMTKGAGAKAEVKDTLIPYLIGALLVAGASSLASVALGLF